MHDLAAPARRPNRMKAEKQNRFLRRCCGRTQVWTPPGQKQSKQVKKLMQDTAGAMQLKTANIFAVSARGWQRALRKEMLSNFTIHPCTIIVGHAGITVREV
eukprot:98733-Alexandrium_andersonii.AAC.1